MARRERGVVVVVCAKCIIICRRDYLASTPQLKKEIENTHPTQLSLVHAKKYLELIQVQLAAQELATSKGNTLIVVDQDELRESMALGNQAVPFLEHAGQYWGPPVDDETAIRELARARLPQSGAKFLVFERPVFWWLEYYKEFHHNLRSQYLCILQNDRLVVFEL
jgi:hypothetical protein